MNIDRAVLAFAGVMILGSLALGYYVSPYWLLLTAFAGVEHAAGCLHGLLPGGDDLQEDRLQERRGLPLDPASRLRLECRTCSPEA